VIFEVIIVNYVQKFFISNMITLHSYETSVTTVRRVQYLRQRIIYVCLSTLIPIFF